MNDLSEHEEQTLNPSPKAYKTSWRSKIIFVGIALGGLGLYGAMLIHRRVSESRYIMHQDIEPITLAPSLMPPLRVTNPQTQAQQHLTFTDDNYTLLNIWATWCPPCQKEMPSLGQLQAALKGKLRVVALSVDDDIDALVSFTKNLDPALTVLWDHDKQSLKFLGVEKYPETFLIGPNGNLVTQFSGPRDWASPSMLDYFLNVLN